MPVKIHLGIDEALEHLLRARELVLYVDGQGETCYRLPTEEDRENWHREFLKENAETLTVQELHRILSMDSRHFSDGILIWFFLGEEDGFWMGKAERGDSDEQVIWLQSDDILFVSIDGQSPSSWMELFCSDS